MLNPRSNSIMFGWSWAAAALIQWDKHKFSSLGSPQGPYFPAAPPPSPCYLSGVCKPYFINMNPPAPHISMKNGKGTFLLNHLQMRALKFRDAAKDPTASVFWLLVPLPSSPLNTLSASALTTNSSWNEEISSTSPGPEKDALTLSSYLDATKTASSLSICRLEWFCRPQQKRAKINGKKMQPSTKSRGMPV